MTNGRSVGPREFYNPTFRAISDRERRKILKVLLRSAPVAQPELARDLAAFARGVRSPTGEEIRRAETRLVHGHLPELRVAGLIAWNRDEDTVSTTSHPALTDRRFDRLLRIESESMDDVLAILSHEFRRIALTRLWDERRTMNRSALADEIRSYLGQEEAPGYLALERIQLALHHNHLPKLSKTNLIDYEAGTGRAVYTAHSGLEDVFRILYEPEERFVDRYDAFLSGLRDTSRRIEPEESYHALWPHAWREPHRG